MPLHFEIPQNQTTLLREIIKHGNNRFTYSKLFEKGKERKTVSIMNMCGIGYIELLCFMQREIVQQIPTHIWHIGKPRSQR